MLLPATTINFSLLFALRTIAWTGAVGRGFLQHDLRHMHGVKDDLQQVQLFTRG